MSSVLVGLKKSIVHYISASGPGCSRSIEIPKYDITINEDRGIREIYKSDSKYNTLVTLPYEIKEIDPNLISDLENLAKSKSEYEQAKLKYEKSKNEFFETEIGKIFQNMLHPSFHPKITEEDAVKKVYDQKVFEKLEEIGTITNTKISVNKGHRDSGDTISVKVVIEKKNNLIGNLFKKDTKLKYEDFPNKIGEFHKSSASCGDTVTIYYQWAYGKYPEHRYQDLKDIQEDEDDFHNENYRLNLSDNITLLDKIRVGRELREKYIEELKQIYT